MYLRSLFHFYTFKQVIIVKFYNYGVNTQQKQAKRKKKRRILCIRLFLLFG
jgi:hypothetical protein